MGVQGRWVKADVKGSTRPCARHGHKCAVVRYRSSADATHGSKASNGRSENGRERLSREDMITKVILLWGSDTQNLLADCFAYDAEASSWSRLPDKSRNWKATLNPTESDITPAASMAVTSHEEFVYIFGGFVTTDKGDGVTNDLLRYDAKAQSFTRLKASGSPPSPRVGATLSYLPATDSTDPLLLLFGGYTFPNEYLNDTYVYNLQTMEWSRPPLKGKSPSPREAHSTVYWAERHGRWRRLVIYGGMRPDERAADRALRLDDVVVLDLDRWQWIHPPIQGPKPPGRSKHTACVYNGKMIVFGGQEGLQADIPLPRHSDDVYAFDIESATWAGPIALNSTHRPAPRADHGAAVIGERLYIYMGELGYSLNGSKCFTLADDIWHLDLGPPLPPDFVTATRVRGYLNVEWAPNRSSPSDRTYEVLIRRAADSPGWWASVYKGPLNTATVRGFITADKSVHALSDDVGYIVRVVTVGWAGKSSDWKAEAGEGDYSRPDFCIVRPVGLEPALPPNNVQIALVPWTPVESPIDENTLATDGVSSFVEKPHIVLTWESPRGSSIDPIATTYRVEIRYRISSAREDIEEERVIKKRRTSSVVRTDAIVRSDTNGVGCFAAGGEAASDWNGEWQAIWEGRESQWTGLPQDLHEKLIKSDQRRNESLQQTSGLKRGRWAEHQDKRSVIGYMFRVMTVRGDDVSQPSSATRELVFNVPQKEIDGGRASSPVPQQDTEAADDMDVDMELDSMEGTASPVPAKSVATTFENGPASDKAVNVQGEDEDEDDDEEEEEEEELMGGVVIPQAHPTQSDAMPTNWTMVPTRVETSQKRVDETVQKPESAPQAKDTAHVSRDQPNSYPQPTSPSLESQQEIDVEGSGSPTEATAPTTSTATQFILDPETNRPALGDPSNGFFFNLHFGDSIEVFSEQEGIPLWYKARALYYSPLGETDWRIKVHYSKYPKKFDEFFALTEQGRTRMRAATGDPKVAEGDYPEDDKMFDVHSDAKKMHVISGKEREAARRGEVIVRVHAAGRKSLG
ncbi:hypothetical protein SpCBS45565_g07786 [Spizellomyces sp. 'palustris']|nr:hypothetical protein SpCBS45565_g07786 [Spizellomyces sp. 'palustris']